MSVTPEQIAQLQGEIQKRKSEIEKLEKGLYGIRVRNRYYVVDIDWPYPAAGLGTNVLQNPANFAADNPANAPYGMVSAPFVVDQGTKFYVKQVSFALLAVGTIPGVGGPPPVTPNVAAQVVVPAILRAAPNGVGSMNFRWKVRSSGSDRDWQNQFLPDWLLQSGSRQGLRFRRAQYCLVGGSEVTVTVAPVRALLIDSASDISTGLSDVKTLRFQFAFGGVEVEA